ncbi:hypothetical protein BJY00DRAFT_295241 [Aspergillus carlsbadensis]|nr:hypothetical protein BJY00DRAFT_295241 [Aspergillus carlsbadensis]
MDQLHEPELTRPRAKAPAKPVQLFNNQKPGALFLWLSTLSARGPPGNCRKIPLHSKNDPVPHLPNWHIQRWVLLHALLPLALHQIYVTTLGTNVGSIGAFILYGLAFTVTGTHEIIVLDRLGYIYGYLDGERHSRDTLARIGGAAPIAALLAASVLRSLLVVWLRYDPSTSPASISWTWLPVEIGLYALVYDFWFYCDHRILHETRLWTYHKTHHLAKHPSTLQSLHIGITEWITVTVGVPTATLLSLRCMGLPMGFYEAWICELNVVWFELAAHCGVRMHAAAPNPFIWLLQRFDVECTIEDHDLHHRAGWKRSYNYGKQSRLWDRVFGTSRGRIESVPGNIDYFDPVSLPLF